MKKLPIALGLGLLGCAGAAAPSETSPPPVETAPPACPESQQEWVHMPVLVGAQPPAPMENEQLAILDEMVASLRARPDIVHLRVEAQGCDGEAAERTEARAVFVRDLLAERGVPTAMMSTAG